MPVAININADNASARPIRALWDEVGRLEQSPSLAGLNYPPHLTLAIYDQFDEAEAAAALTSVFSAEPAFQLRFSAIRWFENDPLVLWAAPEASDRLMQVHAALHAILNPGLCRPYYRPGIWVPHCSLGTAIPTQRRDEALVFTQRQIAPFDVSFDVADVVRFLPVEVIRARPLG